MTGWMPSTSTLTKAPSTSGRSTGCPAAAVAARRIGDARPQQDGVGGGGHGRLDIVDLAVLVVHRSVRQAQLDHHRVGAALVGVALLQLGQRPGCHRKQHIHRILADDRCQRSRAGRDDVADGDAGPADLAGNRRADLGVIQIDLRDAATAPAPTAPAPPATAGWRSRHRRWTAGRPACSAATARGRAGYWRWPAARWYRRPRLPVAAPRPRTGPAPAGTAGRPA